MTTQLFDFGTQPGEMSITTHGHELTDIQLPFQQTIIGGTGEYTGVDGQQVQVYMGDSTCSNRSPK